MPRAPFAVDRVDSLRPQTLVHGHQPRLSRCKPSQPGCQSRFPSVFLQVSCSQTRQWSIICPAKSHFVGCGYAGVHSGLGLPTLRARTPTFASEFIPNRFTFQTCSCLEAQTWLGRCADWQSSLNALPQPLEMPLQVGGKRLAGCQGPQHRSSRKPP